MRLWEPHLQSGCSPGDWGQEPIQSTTHPDSRLPPLLNSHEASLRVSVVQRDSLTALLSEMLVTELQVKRPFLCWIPGGPHHWQTHPCSEG